MVRKVGHVPKIEGKKNGRIFTENDRFSIEFVRLCIKRKIRRGAKMKENKYDDEIFFGNTVRWAVLRKAWREQANGSS